MEVRDTYESLITQEFSDVFTVLNRASLGFELVVAVHLPGGKPMTLSEYLAIKNRLWKAGGHDATPIIGFVPCYQTPEGTVPAFLIYPMSPHSDLQACLNLLLQLKKAVLAPGPRKCLPLPRTFRPDLLPPR